jgi:tetratricopeptide (TPR) repeat protein
VSVRDRIWILTIGPTRGLTAAFLLICLSFGVSSLAQVVEKRPSSTTAGADDSDAEEAAAKLTADRFLIVLERNPRPGTALDKVLEFHLDRGTLSELTDRLTDKAKSLTADKPEEAGRVWMVLGLIAASQGDAEAAQPAFEQAESLLPMNAMASFALGRNLIVLNRWADAADALERAMQRKPAATDLLELFQTLGRVRQRLSQGDDVEAVWSRLEKLVPNDPRVPELIARTLLDDGHWAAALPRFETLAKQTTDPYRRSEFELEVVDLRLKLGQTEQALADADRLLGNLKPDHWLFRETRRRVEDAFLAKEDVAGLLKHYEDRLARQPDDFDAVVRLSRVLVSMDRAQDARTRLEEAIQRAPSAVNLRLELIEHLQQEQLFADAIAQFEQLDRIEPNHPDHVRDWGFLVLKRAATRSSPRPGELEAAARQAADIWKKLVEAKPRDAVVASQVASLMTSADKSLLPDAIALLRRAVELDPGTLSHREQLGEVLDLAGRKEESLAAWKSMAEDARRTPSNLAHLADVLIRFGYRDESLKAIDDACELDRKSLELRFQQAELRRKWKQFSAALEALAEAEKLVDSPESFDRVVQLEVKVLSESERLAERIAEVQAALAQATAAQHFRLAKYLEAADQIAAAAVAARRAAELSPRNGVFLQAAAKLLAADSQWQSAIEFYQRLMKLDRRFRVDSLRAITELEVKLGRKDHALKAGRDLLAAAPSNPENAEYVVEVCLRFQAHAEALQILRRAARQNPAEKRLALKLVDRLMEVQPEGSRQKADGGNVEHSPLATRHSPLPLEEAREALWRTFELTTKSDDRMELARKLGELSVFPGEFAKLTQRLERLRHEPKLSRDAALALVQIHEQAGDTEQARRELQRLLPQAPRDVDLLKRMVSLSESTGNLDEAIVHQRRIAELTRQREMEEHLMLLLRRAGRDAEADLLATRWLETERDPAKVLREIDRLLTSVNLSNARPSTEPFQQALSLSQSWLDRDPSNWEFLSRAAISLVGLGESTKAAVLRDQLLELSLADDTPSLVAAAVPGGQSLAQRIERLRRRLDQVELPLVDYGQARMIALDGRLLVGVSALRKDHPRTVPKTFGASVAAAGSVRAAWDDVYRRWGSSADETLLRSCLALQEALPDDRIADWLALRAVALFRREVPSDLYGPDPKLSGDPLDSAIVDRLVASLGRILEHDDALAWSEPFSLPEVVAREIRRLQKPALMKQLLADVEQHAASPNGIGWLLRQASLRNDVAETRRLLAKYSESLAAHTTSVAHVTIEFSPGNPDAVAWWVQHVLCRSAGQTLADNPQAPSAEVLAARNEILSLLDVAWMRLDAARVPRRSSDFPSRLIQVLRAEPRFFTFTPATEKYPLSLNQLESIARSGEGWLYWYSPDQWWVRTLEFPSLREQPEGALLRMLFQVHAIASRHKWSDALQQHWQAKITKAEPQSREQYHALLATACLRVWSGENSAALESMRQLFPLSGDNPTLQSDIAFFFKQQDKLAESLELLDQIQTTDSRLRKDIEQRAVRLAVQTRNTERLRVAAQRLFGMRLEPQEELELAGTLSGLGLHDEAEAIRQRLPRRAGNNLAVLQQMMTERIEAKQTEEACQIAEQIVRRTSPANTLIGSAQQSTFSGGQQAKVITQSSQARTKALALLGQQGRLGPMIEQAEQQFDRSPQSLKLLGQLVELYDAAGTPEKQTPLLVRLADSDSPDPQFRLTLARALVSAGKAELAVPHLLFAIEKLPSATGQVLLEAEQILSELGHVDELAVIVLKSKLAVNDQQRLELFRRIVQRLHGPPIRAKLIINLFEKAFREAPEFRPMLAAQLLALSGSIWRQEELWPLARDLAVPPESLKNVGPWYGIDVVSKQSGSTGSLLTLNVIELAKQIGKLEELEAHTLAAMKSHPDWTHGGNVTLGLIKLRRQGQTQQAKPLLKAMFRDRKDYDKLFGANSEQMANFDLLTCSLGHELALAGDFPAAAEFYELTAPELALEECRLFGREPLMQTLAVRIVNRLLSRLDDPQELTRQAGSPLFIDAAKITAEIKQPYVSARLAQAMITRWQLPLANNSDGGTWLEQLNHRFADARAAITPAMLPEILLQSARVVQSATGSSSDQRMPNVAVDLLPHVTGDSLAKLRLDTPFVSLLKDVAKDKNLWEKWRNALQETGRSFPATDLSLVILASLTELFAPEQPTERPALALLVELTKAPNTPVAPKMAPPGFHPPLALWTVARECLAREELRSIGEQLAERATESAGQHFDPRFRWAILRERGELARQAGDKEQARLRWTQLTQDVLRPRSSDEVVPMLLNRQFVWSGNWSATRLHHARELCRLALDAGMPDLSLSMFREAADWPRQGDPVGLADDVLAAWDTLEPEWRAKKVSAEAIFTTLLDCVLPNDRPMDVFPFATSRRPVETESLPASVALRLVDRAVEENRVPLLHSRLAERQKSEVDSLGGRLLQVLLARRTNDVATLMAQLQELERRDLSNLNARDRDAMTHLVLTLASLNEHRDQVARVFEQWVAPLGKTFPRDQHPTADVRQWLSRHWLEQQQFERAKEVVAAHLRHMEQVWSATGAMDGQHQRRLELLSLAEAYARAGLTAECLDLLAQVADARWPDKFPDENPGRVLRLLAEKLKSRPAQERYQLWRAWSLPNDGVKSMRLLTGSDVRDVAADAVELHSTAYLLVNAAREADRLAELDAFVEGQMRQRPSDRVHVLLALVHFANKAPAVAEPLVRQQLALWDSPAGKNNSATRSRVWDDWLLAVACRPHESLRELADQLAQRALSGAQELKDRLPNAGTATEPPPRNSRP